VGGIGEERGGGEAGCDIGAKILIMYLTKVYILNNN
jgi:hypothetical protein